FLALVDTEHEPAAAVHFVDETHGERWPPVTGDEHVVRILERERGVDEHLPYARAAVVGAVTMQLLDPWVGREDERDRDLDRHVQPFAIGLGNTSAPVARTSVRSCPCRALAISSATVGPTASVTVIESVAVSGPCPPVPPTCNTSAFVAT